MRRALPPLLACALLAGCQTLYPVPPVEFPTATAPALPASGPAPLPEYQTMAQAQAAPPQANGAIFQAGQYRPLFEDHRARMVGDTLTVQITEKVSATQKNNSSIDKSGSTNASASAFPFLEASQLARLAVSGKTSNNFQGKGSTDSSNDFAGTITATVVGVLPNGHLLVAGEKQIGVNHSVHVLRFTGQVDPRSINPGNTIQSVQIANVRIEQRGRGAQDDAQGMGWLSRFFLNLLPI